MHISCSRLVGFVQELEVPQHLDLFMKPKQREFLCTSFLKAFLHKNNWQILFCSCFMNEACYTIPSHCRSCSSTPTHFQWLKLITENQGWVLPVRLCHLLSVCLFCFLIYLLCHYIYCYIILLCSCLGVESLGKFFLLRLKCFSQLGPIHTPIAIRTFWEEIPTALWERMALTLNCVMRWNAGKTIFLSFYIFWALFYEKVK